MHLISHRGNISGPDPDKENHPDYIAKAIEAGFEVEVDVWRIDNRWLLGHDKPQYEVEESFLSRSNSTFNVTEDILWLHAKNVEALEYLLSGQHNLGAFFWHQNDDFTLSSNGYIWTYPGKKLTNKSICVLPERAKRDILLTCAGICSDYIEDYRE